MRTTNTEDAYMKTVKRPREEPWITVRANNQTKKSKLDATERDKTCEVLQGSHTQHE